MLSKQFIRAAAKWHRSCTYQITERYGLSARFQPPSQSWPRLQPQHPIELMAFVADGMAPDLSGQAQISNTPSAAPVEEHSRGGEIK